MAIDVTDIKKLKQMTGVGLTAAKKALEEAGGDFDKAVEQMRKKGLAKASSKSDREVSAGLVHAYVHGGKIGVLVELNCETDFVAKTDEFKTLANDIALHVAAASPKYLSVESVDKKDEAKEREMIAGQLKQEGKPAEMIDKITEGKINKWYSEVVLLKQPFVKDPDTSVEDVVKSAVAKLGENIVIGQFSRVELGA